MLLCFQYEVHLQSVKNTVCNIQQNWPPAKLETLILSASETTEIESPWYPVYYRILQLVADKMNDHFCKTGKRFFVEASVEVYRRGQKQHGNKAFDVVLPLYRYANSNAKKGTPVSMNQFCFVEVKRERKRWSNECKTTNGSATTTRSALQQSMDMFHNKKEAGFNKKAKTLIGIMALYPNSAF